MNETTRYDTTPALRVIPCGGCGAGLPVAVGKRSVRCAFCGAVCSVPELDSAVELTARAVSAEREGLDALRAVHARRLEPTMTQQVVAGMAWAIIPGSATCTGGLVLHSEGIVSEGMFPVLSYATLGLGALGWYLSRKWLRRRAARKAEQFTCRARRKMRGAEVPAQCPSCGGNVQVPDQAATLSCPFCSMPLLASNGMLVNWVEDAEERRIEWLARADDLLDRVHVRELRAARRAPVVVSVVCMGIALLADFGASSTISSLNLTRLDFDCRGVCRIDGGTCQGGTMTYFLAPGEIKEIQFWVAPGQWRTERVSVPKGERRVFVCPPAPDAKQRNFSRQVPPSSVSNSGR